MMTLSQKGRDNLRKDVWFSFGNLICLLSYPILLRLLWTLRINPSSHAMIIPQFISILVFLFILSPSVIIHHRHNYGHTLRDPNLMILLTLRHPPLRYPNDPALPPLHDPPLQTCMMAIQEKGGHCSSQYLETKNAQA
mmetsp:Transcript_3496/g.7352  ORF Transcript_3496/g.7352 Transcript_3496/m.7352 type:complete len:138 (-) Transcript_3496:105-518(-)